jgi:hypothetical protein
MSTRDDYTGQEWAAVVAGPYLAALYIVVADPNFGYFQEIAAMTKAMIDSASKTANDLIKAVALDLTSSETQGEIRQQFEALKGQEDLAALKETLTDGIVGAADVVATRSTDDGQAYRKWLLYLAEVTAEGSREGGFLGIGAVRVSDREKQGLEELAHALGVSVAP